MPIQTRRLRRAGALALLASALTAAPALAAAGVELAPLVGADLAARNVTSCPEHSCRDGGVTESRRPRLDEDWFDHGCFCDADCATFGDCCWDAAAAGGAARADLRCVQLREYGGVAMVARCPADWPQDGTRRSCERPPAADADPLAALPVTNAASRLTYRNIFCARCHRDAAGAVFWQTRVECPTLPKSLPTEGLHVERGQAGGWGVTVPGEAGAGGTFHSCLVDPSLPKAVAPLVRRCQPAVDSCAPGWSDARVAAFCGAYSGFVYKEEVGGSGGSVFRNPHCALCNSLPADQQLCSLALTLTPRQLVPRNPFREHAFSILLDVGDRSGSDQVGVVSVCPGARLWDPFFRKCRAVACDAGFRLDGDACVEAQPRSFAGGGGSVIHFPGEPEPEPAADDPAAAEFRLCPKFYLAPDEFTRRENGTVHVPQYERTFAPGEYELRSGELAVCALTRDFSKFDSALSYVSMVCLAASALCLFFHLVVFTLVPDLRNLSGKNLASLCVCLLAGYLCFMAAPFQEPGSASCRSVGIVMYTAFVASFFWMNVMAFDVFITLRRATTELRVADGRHLGRFLLYTGYVWLLTGSLVAAAVSTDGADGASEPYRPGFGERVCWFSRRRALMAFFAAPLTAIMVVNVVLFVASARIVRQTASSTAHMTCGPSQMNLRLYSRLAVITGLSWVVGLAAGWLDFPPLWYAFVVLNALQGVFIFVSFTLTERVRSKVRRQASRYSHWAPERPKTATDDGVSSESTELPLTRSRP